MEELIEKLKAQLIEALNLEEVKPEDIDPEAPLLEMKDWDWILLMLWRLSFFWTRNTASN